MTLSAVAVFCGSRFGNDPAYADAAQQTGRLLAERGITLVYGGGRVGLMGTVADATLAAGGTVIGVIPRSLDDREVAHQGLTELHVVETMHERKALMAERSDAFLTLPGGLGTIEEVTEQWTWAQLGIHRKRSGFLDVDGFWAPFQASIEAMVAAGFVTAQHASIASFSPDVTTLLDLLDRPYDWGDKEWDREAPDVQP